MSATNIEKTPESEKRKSTLTRNIADINKNLNNTEKTVKTNKECRYYLKGFCRHGEDCRFEHRSCAASGWKRDYAKTVDAD